MEGPSASGRTAGDYTLLQKIGSGSFADVWKAQHRVTGDVVAIKEIATDRLNRRLRQSLESEVSILRRISHRNIVQLYTVVEVRPQPGRLTCRPTCYPSAAAAQYLRQLCTLLL